jgi:Ser/Thr protein kinase RdoA (MazF antagonist)
MSGNWWTCSRQPLPDMPRGEETQMGMLREYYLQPGAPDPVLTEAEALRCARRFVPGARAVTGVDESGGEARTYTIDDELVLKVQRPQQVRVGTSLAREVFFLNQLAAAAADLPVARVRGYARETHLLEYNVQTRMPGVALANAALPPEARREAIFDAGRWLRRLHAIAQAPLRASAHFPADLNAGEFKARVSAYFGVIARQLEKTGRDWPLDVAYDSVMARTLAALPESAEFAALHSNPGAPHVFVDPESGRFLGVIDLGDAYISHPALDLWRWRWADERAAVLAGYTADAPVSADFLQTWRAIEVLAGALLVAFFPERQAEAVADLRRSLAVL